MHIHERYTETEPGIYTQEFVSPVSDEIGESYKERAIKILDLDQRHYRKHQGDFRTAVAGHGIDLSDCDSWGGGHPKLEATIGFAHITVHDYCADMYEQTHPEFAIRYPECAVEYLHGDFDIYVANETYAVNVFAHFLEHQTPQEARALLTFCNGNSIIIYGPNIAMARNDDWIHYRPDDHNTFWTGSALAGFLKSIGYKHVTVNYIDEDYFIVAS